MKYYLAPLEGITTYICRNVYHNLFYPMDKYFTPFIVPRMKKSMSSREINDILPEHNENMYVVPQLLTNRAEDFIKASHKLMDYGYQEINLNLGCPSGTVVSKGRGAGFLAHPDELRVFLDQIFSELPIRISIKTRIGMESPEEFEYLLEIFNQFPLEELIIHPRIREDYYKNKPNLAVFGEAMEHSRCPVCYNGDVFTKENYGNLIEAFPKLETVMLGRGIIVNPNLREELSEELCSETEKYQKIKEFHARIYEAYRGTSLGDSNVLFKMKELWTYMIHSFPSCEKYWKKIKKADSCRVYEAVVNALFREQ